MPDSIKAISPVSEAATAREHATTQMVWHVGEGKARRHPQPARKVRPWNGREDGDDTQEPPAPNIHHVDILA